MLAEVGKKLAELGYYILNIDSTIVAEEPKLAPYIDAMCERIAEVLNISADKINVKATTNEKLGFEGRKEGISVQAIALIAKR